MARSQAMTVRYALVEIAEAHQRGLVSALNSLAGQLGVDFEPAGGRSPELMIAGVAAVDAVRSDQPDHVQVISFADRRTTGAADLVRPFRVSELRGVLSAALERLRSADTAPAPAAKPRMYRGVPVDSSEPKARRQDEDAPRAGLVYRGSRSG